MSWAKLERGIRFEDFEHEINYAGFVIRSQEELDAMLDITETMAAHGCSDFQIAEATYSYFKNRNLN